jgi:hypothetical protein
LLEKRRGRGGERRRGVDDGGNGFYSGSNENRRY